MEHPLLTLEHDDQEKAPVASSFISDIAIAAAGLFGGSAFTTWWIGTNGMFDQPIQVIIGGGALMCVLACYAGFSRVKK